jgi:hypothetical protein
MPKALEKALLGGVTGFVSGLMEDVMGSSSKDWGEVNVAHNNAVRREQIAARVLASLAGNVAAPLDQPDRLVSMAIDLTSKLMVRLDEEAKKDGAELEALKKAVQASVEAEIGSQGASPYMTGLPPKAVGPLTLKTNTPPVPGPFTQFSSGFENVGDPAIL